MRLAERVYRVVRRLEALPLRMLDAGIVLGGYLCAGLVAYQGKVPLPSHDPGLKLALVGCSALVVHLVANQVGGLYGPVWRYASVNEAVRILLAAVGGAAVTAVLLVTMGRLTGEPVPVAMFPIASFLVLLGCGGIRFQARLFAVQVMVDTDKPDRVTKRSRVMIVGAGHAGAALVTEIRHQPASGMDVVGFVDDDPRQVGRSLRNVRVLGTTDELPRLCLDHSVDRIVIALPSASSAEIRSIMELARPCDARVQVLPPLLELVGGPTLSNVRDIDIADLLGRQQVQIDLQEVRSYLEGAVVLVTGAGGSIGSEIVRQVASLEPKRLLALDNDETHLHDLLSSGVEDAEPVLADVRDQARIEQVMADYIPDVIFHAAAHKHVPLLQAHPQEAVKTNVIGTRNVVEAALRQGCPRFVLISTDKAANPSSVMGSTKRAAELIVHEAGRRYGAQYTAVRFGNVVGSRGSVVPTFMQQILAGGPVTLTHEDATRYFMSIPEAVALVLQAGALADCGDILTLDMGNPVRIADLAVQMIRLAGLRPGVDIDVAVTGLRPGERLHEQLTDEGEAMGDTEHPSIFRVLSDSGASSGSWLELLNQLERFSEEGSSFATTALLEQFLREAGVRCALEIPQPSVVSLIDREEEFASRLWQRASND